MYIAEIGQAILELLGFKVGSGNHYRGISIFQKFSDIFGNVSVNSKPYHPPGQPPGIRTF